MTDTPFCKPCLEKEGKLSHTYKVCRKPSFKCGTCKKYSDASSYEELDYKWRTDFENWKLKVKKIAELSNFKLDENELERIKLVGNR